MIIVNLDVEMAKKKMKLRDLSKYVEITETALSQLKNNRVKAIRFSTLNKICEILDCKPGDILDYQAEEKEAM